VRAVVLPKFGGPEVLTCEDLARPEPNSTQMLIKVAACGVCGHDLLNRAGQFPGTKLPAVMGHEIAGTVVETGSLVNRYKAGDRVALIQRMPCGSCALCRSGRENLCVSGSGFYGEGQLGGYGEYVLANERNAVRVPDSIPLLAASVLSCAVGTGFHALRRARLELGDTVVITAASGGVGIHTVKLAKLQGLRSIAISSSAGKAERLLEVGASEVVIAPDLAFHEQVRELTGGGADAVIEIAGRPTFRSSTRSLKAGGRMVIVGNVDPGDIPFNPATAVLKELEFIGSAHATVADLKKVIDVVARGEIEPEIAACFPLEEAARAHVMMERRSTSGRVVLTHMDGV
jgi:acryloyl-coenzyme A reductase